MKFCMKSFSLLAAVFLVLICSSAYSYDIDTSKTYHIQSAQEYGRGMRGIWDIPGKPGRFQNGQNIQVWDLPSSDRYSADRAFRFIKIRPGVYEIASVMSYASRVDVDGARTNNGTNIKLWSRNHNDAQKFRIKYRGNGRWKIYTMSGRVVCLAARSSNNGRNVHIWQNHNGPWTEWVLLPRYSRIAYMPDRVHKRRPIVKNHRLRGLTANIVYTDRFHRKALNVGRLLRQNGMHVKYKKTGNGRAYEGKLLYKNGYYQQARIIQRLIRRYATLTTQLGRSKKAYRDKQFNIWITRR